METPAPVNLNALKAILANAKKVMNKVENNDFTTGHVDARALTEDGVREMQNEGVVRPQHQSQPTQVSDYTEEQVRNSGLPEAVKKAMLEKKIPKVSMAGNSFTLDDVSELVDKPMGYVKTPTTRTQVTERVVERSSNSDLVTLSKADLKNMMNECLISYLTQTHKALTEDTIHKTINMLIKEGKLTVKKKIN